MSEATEIDSKEEEDQTSSDQSAEKKDSGAGYKTYTEEDIKKLEKKGQDFDALVAKLARDRRERKAEFSKPEAKKPQNDYGQTDDEEDFESDPKKIVQKELAKIEAQRAEQSFANALDKFVRTHPEYSPENDYNDANWKQIKPHIEELKQGVFKGDEAGYLERLEIIHNGIKKPKSEISESKTETVEDSGVGNITSQPKAKKEVPSAMTRPLNEFEKNAAMGFPGKTQKEKEDGYRKKLAELESRRGKK